MEPGILRSSLRICQLRLVLELAGHNLWVRLCGFCERAVIQGVKPQGGLLLKEKAVDVKD